MLRVAGHRWCPCCYTAGSSARPGQEPQALGRPDSTQQSAAHMRNGARTWPPTVPAAALTSSSVPSLHGHQPYAQAPPLVRVYATRSD